MNFEICEYINLITEGELSLQIKLWLMGNRLFQEYFEYYIRVVTFDSSICTRIENSFTNNSILKQQGEEVEEEEEEQEEKNSIYSKKILSLFKIFTYMDTFKLYNICNNNSCVLYNVIRRLPNSVKHLHIEVFNFEKYFLLPPTLISLKIDYLYSNKDLTFKFPDHLKYLQIHQYYKYLYGNLQMLPNNLEILNIYNVIFENKWLENLKKIKTLKIYNSNGNLDFADLQLNKKLKHLIILEIGYANKNLYNVENLLQYCNNLQRLILIYDNLYNIPQNIISLSLLTYLNLSNNKLSFICNDNIFKNLTNLIHLNLSNNELLYLPSSIANLTQLKKLQLQFNQLHEDYYDDNDDDKNNKYCCSNLISNLKMLTSLSLSNNELVNFKCTNCTNLTFLDLSWNHLQKVPQGIFKLKNLTTLYLNCNQLTNIDGLYNDNLRYLNLSENNLQNVWSILNFPSLRTLNLYSNKLETFPLINKNININLKKNLFSTSMQQKLQQHFEHNPFF